jgi:excisionase family DNA binding protein
VLVGIETLVERLGVEVRFVRRLMAERRVPFVKVGRYVRFDIAEVASGSTNSGQRRSFQGRIDIMVGRTCLGSPAWLLESLTAVFEKEDISPDSIELADTLSVSDDAEPTRFVKGDAGDILWEDAGLDGAVPILLRFPD